MHVADLRLAEYLLGGLLLFPVAHADFLKQRAIRAITLERQQMSLILFRNCTAAGMARARFGVNVDRSGQRRLAELSKWVVAE